MGSKKSKLKKLQPEPIQIIQEPISVPKNIHISILGGFQYKNEMCCMVDIFVRDKVYVKNEYRYKIKLNDLNLYIDVENEGSYTRNSRNIYTPFKGFDGFIIVGDLLDAKFSVNIARWIETILYYSKTEKVKMIVGFDGTINVLQTQLLLLKARHVKESLFYTLPEEIVFIIVWFLSQNIGPILLNDIAHIKVNNKVLSACKNANLPFIPVSLKSGYNIDELFTNLIQSTLEDN